MEEQKVKFILNNNPLLSSLVHMQIFFSFGFFFPSSFPFSLLSFSLSFFSPSLSLSLPSFLSTLFSFFILSIITAFIFIVVKYTQHKICHHSHF